MRDRAREFLVEGTNGIEGALESGRRLEVLFVSRPTGATSQVQASEGGEAQFDGLVETARSARVPTFEVSPEVMHAISDAETPPGAVAITPFVDVDPTRLLDSGARL